MRFTDEQQKVIDTEGSNILVSAAAGSGKTAVLVQRIMRKITDTKNKTDIDSLLIMTFTKAAAAEMRQRLTNAIELALKEAILNHNKALAKHLQRQSALIRGAYISTIDGFCSTLLKNHFGKVNIDPGYRVAEEGELLLLRGEILEQVIEEAYEAGDESYLSFVESFSTKKSDKAIEDVILKLYDFSQSKPFPVKYLNACRDAYLCESEDELIKLPFIAAYLDRCKGKLLGIKKRMEHALKICHDGFDAPYFYGDTVESELEFVSLLVSLAQNDDFEGMRSRLTGYVFGRLPSKKDESVSPVKRQIVKDMRDSWKKELSAICEKYFAKSMTQYFEDVSKEALDVKVICDLTERFSTLYREEKLSRGMVDFSDLEHLSLEILYDVDGDGNISYSSIANQYRERFSEIMVDEYQDSNEVQEYLVNAISRKGPGKANVFQVGDVKQSIYRFRLAKPELFMEKRAGYEPVDKVNGKLPESVRIDLHKNFRSSESVVNTVNYVFDQIMVDEVGGVAYDADARLVVGADYNRQYPGSSNMDSELLLCTKSEEAEDRVLEATMIAERIKELMENQYVACGEKDVRPIRYGDIAILLRSASGWSEEFVKVLEENNIPVSATTRTGYFDSYEITTVLNYLSVINNMLDDEIIAAVMKGPFGGFSDEELANIRIAYNECDFSEAVLRYSGRYQEFKSGINVTEEAVTDVTPEDAVKVKSDLNHDEVLINRDLQENLQKFIDKIIDYRSRSLYLPVHDLIMQILDESDFRSLVLSMNNGGNRILNIDMLLEKAAEFEATSYKGLFYFVRYMKQIKKYEVDYGNVNSNNDCDSIKLMTIHKSKGLEFPVCFLAGMSKKFNKADLRGSIIPDSDAGIGVDFIDPIRRVKSSTIIKDAIISKQECESIGEELRVLYVALTRAKEKLIMTGIVKENYLESLGLDAAYLASGSETKLSPDMILSAGSYLDWIMSTACRNKCFDSFIKEYDLALEQNMDISLFSEEFPLKIRLIQPEELVAREVQSEIKGSVIKDRINDIMEEGDNSVITIYDEKFAWKYPYNSVYIPSKLSASKIQHELEENDPSIPVYKEEASEEIKEDIPNFISMESGEPVLVESVSGNSKEPYVYTEGGQEPLIGTVRGTAYHRMFELLDYSGKLDYDGIKSQLERYVEEGRISRLQAGCLNIEDFVTFAGSDIGKRMKAAYIRGELMREQPFTIVVPAREVDEAFDSDEEVLVQGIIDACFIEDGDYIIVDYKTDKVRSGQTLIERHKTQLDYYGRAISQITKKRVTDEILYSVTLGCGISVMNP